MWAFGYLLVLCQARQPARSAARSTWARRAPGPPGVPELRSVHQHRIDDVIPFSPLARAIASLEMFADVMYLALVVSRLIGLSVAHRRFRAQALIQASFAIRPTKRP